MLDVQFTARVSVFGWFLYTTKCKYLRKHCILYSALDGQYFFCSAATEMHPHKDMWMHVSHFVIENLTTMRWLKLFNLLLLEKRIWCQNQTTLPQERCLSCFNFSPRNSGFSNYRHRGRLPLHSALPKQRRKIYRCCQSLKRLDKLFFCVAFPAGRAFIQIWFGCVYFCVVLSSWIHRSHAPWMPHTHTCRDSFRFFFWFFHTVLGLGLMAAVIEVSAFHLRRVFRAALNQRSALFC